jgi:hypothetical protein
VSDEGPMESGGRVGWEVVVMVVIGIVAVEQLAMKFLSESHSETNQEMAFLPGLQSHLSERTSPNDISTRRGPRIFWSTQLLYRRTVHICLGYVTSFDSEMA